MCLSKTFYPLLSIGSTHELGQAIVPNDCKIVDWDVKHKFKLCFTTLQYTKAFNTLKLSHLQTGFNLNANYMAQYVNLSSAACSVRYSCLFKPRKIKYKLNINFIIEVIICL